MQVSIQLSGLTEISAHITSSFVRQCTAHVYTPSTNLLNERNEKGSKHLQNIKSKNVKFHLFHNTDYSPRRNTF